MSQAEKLFTKWLESPPREARFSDVDRILNHFGLIIDTPKSGSHYHLTHPELENFQKQGTVGGLNIKNNTYAIPVHKNMVKRPYIKTIVNFIHYLLEIENGPKTIA